MDEIVEDTKKIFSRLLAKNYVDRAPTCKLDHDVGAYLYKGNELLIHDGMFLELEGTFSYIITASDSDNVIYYLVFPRRSTALFHLGRPDIVICTSEMS